jgi:hypothetical protein
VTFFSSQRNQFTFIDQSNICPPSFRFSMNGSISTETFNLIKFVNKRIILFNFKLHKKEIEEIHAIEIKNKNYTGIQFNMRREKENSNQLLKYFHSFIQHSSILVYFDPNDFKILKHSLKKQNLRISLESFCLQVSLTILISRISLKNCIQMLISLIFSR